MSVHAEMPRQPCAAAIAVGVALIFAGLAPASSSQQPKRVIYYGWWNPDTKELHDRCEEMERLPFDGVGVSVAIDRGASPEVLHSGNNLLGWAVTGTRRFSTGEFAAAIEDLKTARCRRFTENFLSIVLAGDASRGLDWADDERWRTIAANARVVAQIAERGGAKGLVVDPEHYASKLFQYSTNGQPGVASFRQRARIARSRGRQVGEALGAAFPDVRLLCLFAYTLPLSEVSRGIALESSEYALLPAFFDGLLEALPEPAELIDGYEFSYPFKRREQFADGYLRIHRLAARLSELPKLYRARISAGFGLWLDYRRDPAFFQPSELESAVAEALRASDRYVWIYSEGVNPFAPKPGEPPYAEAIAEARRQTEGAS